MFKALLFFIGILTLSGCALFQSESPEALVEACTIKAKLCSDGSIVGIVGPGCTFAPCPDEVPQEENSWKQFSASDIREVHNAFTFQGRIPLSWAIEAIPEIEAINIYDPSAEMESNIEKSQIFIRYFEADSFLTLSTVTIFSQEQKLIGGREAILYDIEKREGVSKFPHQPSWRNTRHMVLDVRESDKNPSVFYVIAKRPDLPQEVFDLFISSLTFAEGSSSSLLFPIVQFRERVTKKPFGMYITPETSPVSDDPFTGFHTGVDVEYDDIPGDVVVVAFSSGTVVLSRWVAGYGGVAVLAHLIEGREYLGIYGHLDPLSLPQTGAILKKGERIGILGESNTDETDGARKHLHFGLLKGNNIDLRGYVNRKELLNAWEDPLKLLTP